MLQISPCDSTFFLRLNTLPTAESRIIFKEGEPRIMLEGVVESMTLFRCFVMDI